MRRAILKIVCVLVFLFQTTYCLGFAMQTPTGIIDKQNTELLKHYITPEQIVISEEGISIFMENVHLIATSIFHDDFGFYFLETGVYWICGNCGTLNDLDNNECSNCGEPY